MMIHDGNGMLTTSAKVVGNVTKGLGIKDSPVRLNIINKLTNNC